MKNTTENEMKRVIGVNGDTFTLLNFKTGEQTQESDIGTGKALRIPLFRQLEAIRKYGDEEFKLSILFTSCHFDWETKKPSCIMINHLDGQVINLVQALMSIEKYSKVEGEYLKRLWRLQKEGVRGMYSPDSNITFGVNNTETFYENLDYQLVTEKKYFIPLLEVEDNSFIPVIQCDTGFYLSTVIYDSAMLKQCLPVFGTEHGDVWCYWNNKNVGHLKGSLDSVAVVSNELANGSHSLSKKEVYFRLGTDCFSRSFNQLEYMLYTDLIDETRLTLLNGSFGVDKFVCRS